MNWTSFKFIAGFVFILLAALVFLVYLSGGNIDKKVDPIENIAEEQV